MLNEHPFTKKLATMESKIDRLVRIIENSNSVNDKNKVFTNEGLMVLLNISSKTLQKWRDEKMIRYSKIGNKYYYSKKDVDDMLNDHRKGKNKKKCM